MPRVYVKDGTSIETASLCLSCNNAHIIRGYRECEEIVYCNYVLEQLIQVDFKVRECSNHADRNRPTWDQMERLAIEIRPEPSFKPVGFRNRSDRQTVTEKDE